MHVVSQRQLACERTERRCRVLHLLPVGRSTPRKRGLHSGQLSLCNRQLRCGVCLLQLQRAQVGARWCR
jgi:hypothetical protein